jgi:hypothetical protein
LWLSATPDVAESHKINTQFTYIAYCQWEVVHFTSHKQRISFTAKICLQGICQFFPDALCGGFGLGKNIEGCFLA